MVKIVIEGTTFSVPEEIIYRQYKHVAKIFKSLKADVSQILEAKANGSTINFSLSISDVIEAMIEQDKLPELLATILVPEGQIWEVSFVEKYKDKMEIIGDKTFMEIAKDFLAGRTDLIQDIVSFLGMFQEEKNPSLMNSNQEAEIEA